MAGLGKQLRGTGIARIQMKKGGMAQQAAIAISKKESGKYDKVCIPIHSLT